MNRLLDRGLVLLLFFLSLSLAKESKKEETSKKTKSDVIELTDSNFDVMIKKHDMIMVKFYAPWCGHCKEMAPKYEKLATKMKKAESKFVFGKLDGTVHMVIGQKYRVLGYPTLKFFYKGLPIDYEGPRENDEIVKFMEKKSMNPTKAFTSEKEMDKIVESNGVAIIGFFKDLESKEAKTFREASRLTSYVEFIVTSDEGILKKFGFEKHGIIAQNDFPENTGKDISVKRSTYKGAFNREQIINWAKIKATPLLLEFNDQSSQKISSSEELDQHVIVFAKFTGKDALSKKARDQLMIEYAGAAEKYKDKFFFIYVDLGDPRNLPMFSYFGGKVENTPFFMIFNLKDVSKFHPQEGANTLTTKNIVNLIDLYLNKKAKQFFLSAELPKDWDSKPLKYIVQKNFLDVTHNKKKDAMVLYISNECEQCGDKIKMMEKLAKKYKKSDNKVFAVLNIGINEFQDESLTTDVVPTVRLFKKKTNEMIEFFGQFSVDNLKKFLLKYDVQNRPATNLEEEEKEREHTEL